MIDESDLPTAGGITLDPFSNWRHLQTRHLNFPIYTRNKLAQAKSPAAQDTESPFFVLRGMASVVFYAILFVLVFSLIVFIVLFGPAPRFRYVGSKRPLTLGIPPLGLRTLYSRRMCRGLCEVWMGGSRVGELERCVDMSSQQEPR